jgi:hypothetical protein
MYYRRRPATLIMAIQYKEHKDQATGINLVFQPDTDENEPTTFTSPMLSAIAEMVKKVKGIQNTQEYFALLKDAEGTLALIPATFLEDINDRPVAIIKRSTPVENDTRNPPLVILTKRMTLPGYDEFHRMIVAPMDHDTFAILNARFFEESFSEDLQQHLNRLKPLRVNERETVPAMEAV